MNGIMAPCEAKNKAAVQQQVGEQQVKIWRRSFSAVPPLLDHVSQDRRYDAFGSHVEPRGESLEMAYHRLMPYWEDQVAPRLLDGRKPTHCGPREYVTSVD